MQTKVNKQLKIVFAGTTDFAEKYLSALVKSKHKIVYVMTKKISIKNKYISKLINNCLKNSIPMILEKNLNNNKIVKKIQKKKPDIMIIVAYGIKIPQNIIKIFPMKALNIHPSILPKWRGPAPIQRAILNGDRKTGVSIISINQKFDSGNILNIKTCKIYKNDTFLSLSKKLCNIGIKSMFISLINIFKRKKTLKQKTDKTKYFYAHKISRHETKINWNNTAKYLERSIRAFYPSPGSYFFFKKKRIKVFQSEVFINSKEYSCGKIIKILKDGIYISTKKNCLIIKKIQFEGKKMINSIDIYNGYKNFFQIGETIL
ncbi:methionyl-tRNA formyltransferase [Buchnera aphidicola (Chaitoregma tattakana)]|uniref:methionyl-tRNA formyltransferase n=1 Tax=Buchnera aphidicola TaxID=9 RepID=UPI0031B8B0BE